MLNAFVDGNTKGLNCLKFCYCLNVYKENLPKYTQRELTEPQPGAVKPHRFGTQHTHFQLSPASILSKLPNMLMQNCL